MIVLIVLEHRLDSTRTYSLCNKYITTHVTVLFDTMESSGISSKTIYCINTHAICACGRGFGVFESIKKLVSVIHHTGGN